MGGDYWGNVVQNKPNEFQSTPPHGGRLTTPKVTKSTFVSIHAPAWGATSFANINPFTIRFQSTPPHGGRQLCGLKRLYKSLVSIHAPAWGATAFKPTVPWGLRLFQSTPPHGGRPLLASSIHIIHLSFNPRPRMGGDGLRRPGPGARRGFNPRPRMGGDLLPPCGLDAALAVSIHAPAWGATWRCSTSSPGPVVSIHAPAWGATVMHIINTF